MQWGLRSTARDRAGPPRALGAHDCRCSEGPGRDTTGMRLRLMYDPKETIKWQLGDEDELRHQVG